MVSASLTSIGALTLTGLVLWHLLRKPILCRHDYIMMRGANRLWLRCLHCGRETEGIKI